MPDDVGRSRTTQEAASGICPVLSGFVRGWMRLSGVGSGLEGGEMREVVGDFRLRRTSPPEAGNTLGIGNRHHVLLTHYTHS